VTPETEALLAFDVDAAIRAAQEADVKRSPEERERHAGARVAAREAAARFLRGLWTRALRGPVAEPHAADGWDSGLRVAVAQSLAARLLAYGVPADLTALLLAGWAATYTEPALEEEHVLELVRRREPAEFAREAA